MDWIQVFTIIGVLGGFMLWMMNKLDSDIKKINARQTATDARLDKLYEIWVTTTKEIRDIQLEIKEIKLSQSK